jgi:hypothetical protein
MLHHTIVFLSMVVMGGNSQSVASYYASNGCDGLRFGAVPTTCVADWVLRLMLHQCSAASVSTLHLWETKQFSPGVLMHTGPRVMGPCAGSALSCRPTVWPRRRSSPPCWGRALRWTQSCRYAVLLYQPQRHYSSCPPVNCVAVVVVAIVTLNQWDPHHCHTNSHGKLHTVHSKTGRHC